MNKSLLLSLLTLTLATSLQAGLSSGTAMPNEWEEFRFERLTVLKADAALAQEEKDLNAEILAQKKKVDAATIKVDASVAPTIDKVDAALKNGWGAAKVGKTKITTEEWQKLRSARDAALKADASLAADNKALLKKKDAFEAKVDAALVKVDPKAAVFLTQKRD